MKIKKIIVILLLSVLYSIKVSALNVNIDYQANIYSNKLNGYVTYYGNLGYIGIDNKLAYCLEPYKLIGDNYYVDNNFFNRFSLDDQKYFKLVSYYGYNNTNHNNVFYYMAAQELIWRRITNQEVYWTTKTATKGDRIDIEYYKNEISNLISRHYIKPNFNQSKISGNFNQVIELTDTNNVLNDYSIEYNGKNKIWKNNNKLYIKLRSKEYENIKLIKRINNGLTDTAYVSSNGQAIASFGMNENMEINIMAKATNYSSKLEIFFKDNETYKKINGLIKFKIKNIDTNEYYIYNNNDTFSTETGYYLSPFYLEEGNYEIETIDVPNNYILNNGNKIFSIMHKYMNDNDITTVEETLNKSKGYVIINRHFSGIDLENKRKLKTYYLHNIKYNMYAAENIIDEDGNIVYKKDELVDTFITNNNGQAVSKFVEIGEYYIIEETNEDIKYIPYTEKIQVKFSYMNNLTRYIKKEFNIKTAYNTFEFKLNVKEKAKKCKQHVCNNVINNLKYIEYGIYADEDIYLIDKKMYSKDELIIKFKSNDEGNIIDNILLPYGKYYIKELTNMSKYENRFDNYLFINNSQNNSINLEIVKKLQINEKELDINDINSFEENLENMKLLPNTNNKYLRYYIISFILLLLGLYGLNKNAKM